MEMPLPDDAARALRSYLRSADRLLPGGIVACAVGGSIALEAYRPGHSDVDLVAVVADEWRFRRDLIGRLRALHLSQLPRLTLRAARGLGFSACCNTVFIWESELSLPVTKIHPIASHTGEVFDSRGAFDVNPVIWKELVDGGISIRGQDISAWELDPQPDVLRDWVLRNLADYWSPLAHSVGRKRRPLFAREVEWCLLGPARMRHTIVTGEIVSKEEAGQHALAVFAEHTRIIEVALAHLRHMPIPEDPPREEWRARTVSAMSAIIAEASRHKLP